MKRRRQHGAIRAHERSRFARAITDAMADQWGDLMVETIRALKSPTAPKAA